MIEPLLLYAMTVAAPLFVGEPELIAEDRQFTEGPLWLPNRGMLAYSDIPADTIYLEDGSTLRKPSGKTNGLTRDNEGRIICFEHGGRRVSRIEPNGDITTIASRYDGKRFNSPNDGVVRNDGVLFFTDPQYGLAGREKEIPFQGVYAVDTTGAVHLIAQDFAAPNGIDMAPGQQWLYVADTQNGHVRRLAVDKDFQVTADSVFCRVPAPDGLRTDTHGNLWVTSSRGVVVFDPQGNEIAVQEFPQQPANCAFGGNGFQTLYVTARSAVYAIQTATKGLP